MSAQEQESAPAQQPSVQEEREASIRALEQKAKRRHAGVRWPAAVIGILMGLGALWWIAPDIAYFFSPREPITLGTEGDYHLERMEPNRYVQIHGTPTDRAAYSREGDTTMVHVGLVGTPIMVRRKALPNEDWIPGRPALAPDQRPFGVRGRLMPESLAHKYAQGFDILREVQGIVVPKDKKLWVIVEGASPGDFTSDVTLAGVLVAFILLNAFFVVRDVRARLRR